MSNLLSINLKECIPATSICHNSIDRDKEKVEYLITEPNTISNYRHDLKTFNENVKTAKNEIYNYFTLRQAEINTDYKQNHNNRNIKKDTKLYQEAVISFGREQFEKCSRDEVLKSIEMFSNNFEQKYGCKVLMTSLHLDEGFKKENGEIDHNYHAHVLIENYSFETHKTCLQKLDYRKLQTELANDFETLGFERGKDYTELQKVENQLAKEEHREPKRLKPIRLEHREYRQMKEQQTELEIEIEQLKAQLKEQYDANRKTLKESGTAKQVDYQTLKKRYEQAVANLTHKLKNDLFEARKEGFNLYEKKLEDANTSLTKKTALKLIKKPYSSIPAYDVPDHTKRLIFDAMALKQKNEEVPKYVETIVEKKVEKIVVVDIDENKRLKEELRIANLREIAKNVNNDSNINNLKHTIELQKQENETQKIEISDLQKENNEIKEEYTALKNAVERFLSLPIIKPFIKASKSLLGQFTSVFEGVQDALENTQSQKIENVQLKMQNEVQKSLHQPTTCAELLDYYEIIAPELVKDARNTGSFIVHEAGYIPYQVQIDVKFTELAEALAIVTNHDISNKLNLSNGKGWSR